MDKPAIFKILWGWLARYVKSLAGRDQVIIDIDASDDPSYGAEQISMYNGYFYNGYYGQFMYNELLFHEAETGQMILPVLRPGGIVIQINGMYLSLKELFGLLNHNTQI